MSSHPFVGEGFDSDRAIKFWDDLAYDYEGGTMQGDIPLQIIDHITKEGMIGKDSDIIEFGCGPGTYTIPLSGRVRSVTCVDTSENMLSILSQRCSSNNIIPILGDYMTVPLKRKYDATVMSLCPGSGSKEAIRRVESVSYGWCIHIMWLVNSWDDIGSMVWKELGKDYSFEQRRSGIVEGNLESLGREFDVRRFTTRLHLEMPAEELIEREKRRFALYGPYDAEEAIRKVLGRYIRDGVFRFDCTNEMKLICWRPASC